MLIYVPLGLDILNYFYSLLFWVNSRESDSDSEPSSPIRIPNKIEKARDPGSQERSEKLEKKVSMKYVFKSLQYDAIKV